MTELFDDYRRKGGHRDDPRLSRASPSEGQSNKELSSVHGAPKLANKNSESDLNTKDPSYQRFQSQAPNQYNTCTMQSAYQHLQPNMYSDPNQYQTQGYSTSYNAYQTVYAPQSNAYNQYQGYNQGQTGYSTGAIQPGPPGEEYPHNEWAPTSAYPQQPPQQVHQPQHMIVDEEIKKDAVAQELKHHKANMSKQREDYVRKVIVLRRELELLRNQKQELLTQHTSEHDNNHIMRENHKLQIEIQNKMKSIYNVIEMLTNIIGDKMGPQELEDLCREESPKVRKEKSQRIALV